MRTFALFLNVFLAILALCSARVPLYETDSQLVNKQTGDKYLYYVLPGYTLEDIEVEGTEVEDAKMEDTEVEDAIMEDTAMDIFKPTELEPLKGKVCVVVKCQINRFKVKICVCVRWR